MPKQAYDLTDAEKRDLTQIIQQGKALQQTERVRLRVNAAKKAA